MSGLSHYQDYHNTQTSDIHEKAEFLYRIISHRLLIDILCYNGLGRCYY